MKSSIAFVLVLMSAFHLWAGSEARADQHAVTIVSRSSQSLVDLAAHLPSELQSQISGLSTKAMGSVLLASAQDQPLGVWLDWQTDLPRFVFFVRSVDMAQLTESMKAAGMEPKQHGNGIAEVDIGSPLFYRSVADWFYVATTMEDLQRVENPLQALPNGIDHDVVMHVNLTQIPQGVRTTLAEVLGQRLLPPAVSAPNEVNGDTLVHLYTTRALNELATLTEKLTVTIDSDEKALALNVDADSRQLSQFVNQSPKLPMPGLNEMQQGLALHTSLADEEVARLTWWTQSVPDQIANSFRAAEIDQRSDVEGILQIATLFSRIMRDVTQSGEIEGFVTLLDDENQTPIVGAMIKSGDEFEKNLQQWLGSPYAAEMQVRGVELDIERIQALRVSRITVGEPGETPLSIIYAIADDRMYVTVGQEGLDGLRNLVSRTNEEVSPPKPIQVRLNNVSLASLLGWEASADSLRQLELDSRYTKGGRHYELRLIKP